MLKNRFILTKAGTRLRTMTRFRTGKPDSAREQLQTGITKHSYSAMAFSRVNEGRVTILAPAAQLVSKSLPVFYNPVMYLNRDLAVLLLAALNRKGLVV